MPLRSVAPNGTHPIERALYIGLLTVVFLAGVPIGSARPLAWDILGIAVALLLALLIFVPRSRVANFQRELRIPAAMFLTMVAFVIFQTSTLTPAGLDNALWAYPANAFGSTSGSVAIDRSAAVVGLFRWMTYAGVFYIAHFLGRDPLRVAGAMRGAVAAGSAYAVYGLIVYGTNNSYVLWFYKTAYWDDLTGTFVNRNSFATYMGLYLMATLACLARSATEMRVRASRLDRLQSKIDFVGHNAWIFIALFVQATALFLTHSRGGNLSAVAAVLAFALAISHAPSLTRFRIAPVAWTGALLIFGAFLISGGAVLDRLARADTVTNQRVAIYKEAFRAVRDHPLLGTGLGSFTEIFPLYRLPDIPTGFVNAAHNDYLQNMVEVGIPATVVLIAAIAWLFGLCIRGIRVRRRDAIFPCLGIAITVLVGVHSLVDFSLQIPAVTVLYMLLLGLAVAQSRSSGESAVRSEISVQGSGKAR